MVRVEVVLPTPPFWLANTALNIFLGGLSAAPRLISVIGFDLQLANANSVFEFGDVFRQPTAVLIGRVLLRRDYLFRLDPARQGLHGHANGVSDFGGNKIQRSLSGRQVGYIPF